MQLSLTRHLLHGGDENDGDSGVTAPEEDIDWLKWTALGILFAEVLVGTAVPVLFQVKYGQDRFRGCLALLNCFAGGVFFTFGLMHLLPDSVETLSELYDKRFPLAYFFPAVAFYTMFFLARVLNRSSQHQHHNPVLDSDNEEVGGKTMNNMLFATTAHTPKADLLPSDPEVGVPCQDPKCHHNSAAATPPGVRLAKGTSAHLAGGPTMVALLCSALLFLAISAHAVLEGLALGLQGSYSGVVTVFVALVTHKWVEAVALTTRMLKVNISPLRVLLYLTFFASMVPVGIIIGVEVSNTSPWVEGVLFGLASGVFLYIGAFEIIAEEFAQHGNDATRISKFWLFLATMAGFALVALLQLVNDGG